MKNKFRIIVQPKDGLSDQGEPYVVEHATLCGAVSSTVHEMVTTIAPDDDMAADIFRQVLPALGQVCSDYYFAEGLEERHIASECDMDGAGVEVTLTLLKAQE